MYQHAFSRSSFEQHLHGFLSPRQFFTSPVLGFFPLFLQFRTLIEEMLKSFFSLPAKRAEAGSSGVASGDSTSNPGVIKEKWW